MELAQLDVTLHYKFTEHWGGYLVMSGVNYSGGFLDRAIESFHDVFGFDNNGRPAVERNAVNLIADLNNANIAVFDAPTTGGLLDPTIGVRYSSPQQLKGWNFVLEAAAKLALQGEEEFLSTGKSDYGVQATLQRFGDHHAWYVSASAVYYDGRSSITPTDPQVVPTLVLGYERKLERQDAPGPADLHQRQHLLEGRHASSMSCSTPSCSSASGSTGAWGAACCPSRSPRTCRTSTTRRTSACSSAGPTARRSRRRATDQAGWTFAFRRNRFFGSYFFLISRSRGRLPW